MKHLHRKDFGSFGEALVISQVLENGCSVFHEFGDNSKIDLIVEDSDHKLHRIQVKTTTREHNTPDVSKLYVYKTGPGYKFVYEETMIDWFAVVDDVTRKIAWIPATEALQVKTQMSLRHDTPKNSQKSGVRYFDDYTTFPFD